MAPDSEANVGAPAAEVPMVRTKSISVLDALAEIQAAADKVLESKSPKQGTAGLQGKVSVGPPRCATAQQRRFKSVDSSQQHRHDGGSATLLKPYFRFRIPEWKTQKTQKMHNDQKQQAHKVFAGTTGSRNSPLRSQAKHERGSGARNAKSPDGASSGGDIPCLMGRACATPDPSRKRRPPSAFEIQRRLQAQSRAREIEEYKRAVHR